MIEIIIDGHSYKIKRLTATAILIHARQSYERDFRKAKADDDIEEMDFCSTRMDYIDDIIADINPD